MTRDTAIRARVRGVYATALTRTLLDAGHDVVQASEPIRRRFDAAFETADHDVTVDATADRQGVGVAGDPEAASAAATALREAGVDALGWWDPAPEGAVFDGRVTDTRGGGAVVDLGVGVSARGVGAGAHEATSDPDGVGDGDTATDAAEAALPGAARPGDGAEGYLPFRNVEDRVETGDAVRVQVVEGASPWGDDRPVLDADLRALGGLATLVPGRERPTVEGRDDDAARELVGMTDLLDADLPEGWGVRWRREAADADMAALSAALDRAIGQARAMDDALDRAGDAGDADAPRPVVAPTATAWVWFGRASRFGLDTRRREVTATMPGHHRIKAAADAASAGVDFAEALCAGTFDAAGTDDADPEDGFPFEVVTDQFGPVEGDRVRIGHGKPDGRLLTLGEGEVVERDADGTVAVRREMSGGGTYDALGVSRESGDAALTKFREGRWWYPTVYRDADGGQKGTYVNVCTPVECFPDAIRYVDLHVDVVKHRDGRVERVDDDELDAAVADGRIREPLAEKARSVASGLERAL